VVTLWHFFSHKNPLYELDWNFILFYFLQSPSGENSPKRKKKKPNTDYQTMMAFTMIN
jgi:hypothetical protein